MVVLPYEMVLSDKGTTSNLYPCDRNAVGNELYENGGQFIFGHWMEMGVQNNNSKE
jgi:hypothetical protein